MSNQIEMSNREITINLNDDRYNCLYSGVKSEHLKYIEIKRVVFNIKEYFILKYKKPFILDKFHHNPLSVLPHDKYTFDIDIDEGMFRSVIASNGKILSYSPSKSYGFELFKNMYNQTEKKEQKMEDLCVEEFIEGTMINVFYEDYDQLYDEQKGKKSKWIINTKSNIGAHNVYFTDGKIDKSQDTFEKMFLDACANNDFELNDFNKKYNYTFVLQHPRNNIVCKILYPRLYLIDVYSIENNCVTILNKTEHLNSLLNKHISLNVKIPRRENLVVDNLDNFDENYYYNKWHNLDNNIVMGVMIKHKNYSYRTTFRNPKYEYLKKLRGNQPKSEARYIELWKEDKLVDFLSYFTEYNDKFKDYKVKLLKLIYNVYNTYVSCFIHKLVKLEDVSYELKPHMYYLHNLYRNELKPNKKSMHISVVFNYFKNMPLSQIMYTMNYSYRPIQEVVEVKE